MFKNLNFFFFLFFMFLGVSFSISSNNWILIWCGLELILICFIPLILNSNFISSECCLKYFIIQSMSSSLLILSIMLMLMNMDFKFEYIFNVSLMIKMGVVPFHTWVLNIVDGLKFNMLFLMVTLLKLPPLYILSYISFYLNPFIIFSLLLGSLLGLNQNSFRSILGYSSIFNMGFILSCLLFNYIWLFYLFFYSVILFSLIYWLNLFNINYMNQFILNMYNPFINFVLLTSLLSMGGLPPFLGFMIKLIVLEFTLYLNFYLISFLMIISSLMVMYYYIRATFLSIMISSFLPMFNLNLITNNVLFILVLNLFSLVFLVNIKIFI
nr:NADH dehydrogenase subunit 2 [Empoasca serrata]